MEIITLLIIGILMGLWANIQIMSLIKTIKRLQEDAEQERMDTIRARLDYFRRSSTIHED